MSIGQIAFLTLQGSIFLVWTVLMFSVLFTLRARAQARTGTIFNGPLEFLAEIGAWLRNPTDKSMRWALGIVTLCLFVMTGQSVLVGIG